MQMDFFNKVAMMEDDTDLETQQKIRALKTFLTKHHRHVKHLTKEVANFEKEEKFFSVSEVRARSSANGKRREQVHSPAKQQRPIQNPESAAALEQHCDTIQNMMTTFISSLKTAKENILLYDQPTNAVQSKQVPLHVAEYSKQVRAQELTNQRPQKQKKVVSQQKLMSSM